MVAPVESPLSELETGADTHHHLLYKKFKYVPKGIAPKSREETEAMATTTTESQPLAAPNPPPEVVTSPKGNSSPLIGARASASPDASRGRASPLPSPPSRDKPAYMIRWNRFEEQVCNAFAELFCSDHFVDVTLACEGEMMKAHKIVLAMSSPFFRRIFQETPCKHPVVIIKGMTPKTLRSVLQYIYLGEVTLNKSEINSFMDAADYLSICGVFANLYSCDISTTVVREEGRENDNEMEQDFDKPPSSDGGQDQDPRTASESEGGGPTTSFRDDSQSEEGEGSSQTSNVIKYHGIKSRWTRRYSNTSYHGTPTAGSPVETDHKRSASAGEVEPSGEQAERLSVPAEGENAKVPESEEGTQRKDEMDLETPTGDEESTDERTCISDDPDSAREQRIIHRGYAKYYLSTYDETPEHPREDITRNEPQYSLHGSTPVSRPRGLPYAIGAKDFSHPLQVSVDPHPQQPPPQMYGGPVSATSTSSGGGKVESSVRLKTQSGFTMYSSSSHSVPSQRTMFRTQSESEFPITSSPMSLLSSHHHHREDRSATRTSPQSSYHRQHQHQHHQHHHQSHSLHPQNPASHQFHSSSDHPHGRPHLPLLSTQPSWPVPEHQRSRGPPPLPMEETVREVDEFRFRSHSMDRDFPGYGGAREFFSHSNQLRGVPGFGSKSHSYPTATDLSVSSLSQQYSLGFMPQLKSPSSSSSTATRPKTKAIRSSQVPQSARYTAAEVDQMVDAVANYPGNIVPCTLCQKFVKRERLRAHIHECHLLSGEKIICPHCGIALKSKGSFRVHIWRHKRGALPTRNTMTDFGQDRPPSPHSGPASH